MANRPPKSDGPTLSNPEGIAMLAVAAFADLVPPVFILLLDIAFGVGELVSWAFDILFTIVLGGWMFIRGGEKMKTGKKVGQFLKRRAPWMAGEYVPILGSIAPFWLINTFLFLREQ